MVNSQSGLKGRSDPHRPFRLLHGRCRQRAVRTSPPLRRRAAECERAMGRKLRNPLESSSGDLPIQLVRRIMVDVSAVEAGTSQGCITCAVTLPPFVQGMREHHSLSPFTLLRLVTTAGIGRRSLRPTVLCRGSPVEVPGGHREASSSRSKSPCKAKAHGRALLFQGLQPARRLQQVT